MKLIPAFPLFSLTLFSFALQAKDITSLPKQNRVVSFTENKGQFADQNYNPRPDILFGGSDGQLTFYITNKGISYQLYRSDAYKEVEDPKTKEKRDEIIEQTIYRTDIKWINANVKPLVVTDQALPGYNNFYMEQCPKGAINVKTYTGITLQNIYTNINLHYYESEGHLKYDYIVAANADYKQIQLKVDGGSLKLLKDGSLIIETPLGKIQEPAPVVFQNGKQMKARYIVRDNIIGFEVDNYDAKYELIIDPVTRLWGTYYGGTGDDMGTSTKADASGNIFIAGHSTNNTSTVIATTGSHQNTFGGGMFDAYLAKFNNAGVRAWSTYYGGNGSDFATGCDIDASGNIFMVGYTSSNSGTVMATAGSHQSTYGGGSYDAYMVQFNTAGVRMWGTYYGGTGTDVGNSCLIDASGALYMAGYTGSNTGTVIATSASHQNIYGGGTWDAYLVKFTTSGTRNWGTYYGGSGNDVSYACAADPSGNVFLAGHSASSGGTVIAATGSHQSANNGGDDGFLAKFNSNGVRQWATYYGGTAYENVYGCVADASGNVFIAGHTASSSGTVIATVGSHQSTFAGGSDIFVVKFNSNGVRAWGSYYGDTGTDCCWSCSSDASGNIYLLGYASTSSGTVIATPGSHQTTYGGGTYDAYLAKFSTNGQRVWGTYYGGSGDDSGGAAAIDGSGNIYFVGLTSSGTGTVIATGSHQAANGGSSDAFLVKFADCNLLTAAVNATVCAGSTLSLTATYNGTVNPTFNWAGPNSFTSAIQNPTIAIVAPVNIGIYTLTVNHGICSETSTMQVSTINSQPSITVNSGTICSGTSFVIIPNGANTYTITGGNFTVNPTTTKTYSVTGTNSVGCISPNVVSTVSVSACTGLKENGNLNIRSSVSIYPNPSSGSLKIQCDYDAYVRVIDLQGRVLKNFKINSGYNYASIEEFENGLYVFEVVGDANKKHAFRVVKQ